jgi:hypothetical protein
MGPATDMTEHRSERRLAPMDYLAIVGGVINFLVIGYLIGYWLFH